MCTYVYYQQVSWWNGLCIPSTLGQSSGWLRPPLYTQELITLKPYLWPQWQTWQTHFNLFFWDLLEVHLQFTRCKSTSFMVTFPFRSLTNWVYTRNIPKRQFEEWKSWASIRIGGGSPRFSGTGPDDPVDHPRLKGWDDQELPGTSDVWVVLPQLGIFTGQSGRFHHKNWDSTTDLKDWIMD